MTKKLKKTTSYADIVLVNLHSKNLELVLDSLVSKKIRCGNLTQIYILCHKSHKNPLFGYEAILRVMEILNRHQAKPFIVKDMITVVKTKPQYITPNISEINLHGHQMFALIKKGNKTLWRNRKNNINMRFLANPEANCCGDVWTVNNKRNTDFPLNLEKGIYEFTNLPVKSNVIKIGFEEYP